MRWSSAVSDLSELDRALSAALDDAAHELAASADVAFVFVAGHRRDALATVPHVVRERAPRALLVGCTASGVAGGGLELEGRTAVSVTLGSLPGVELVPFHVDAVDDATTTAASLRRSIGRADAVVSLLEGVDGQGLADAFDTAFPGASAIGGVASGGQRPGERALFLGDALHPVGAVGVAMRGAALDTVVAQGCRPIGDAMFVTRHRGHLLQELNGKPVVQVLEALYESLPEGDRALFKSALFLGVGMEEDRREYRQGDFLVRNVGGLQRISSPDGSAITDAPRGLVASTTFTPYQVVQFHLRDARASADDLETMLRRYREATKAPPAGALMFSCVGRGQGLYGQPNHDSDAFHRVIGGGREVPLGGFFSGGELGPVRGRTFLHAYTSCFGLFRPA